jgi:transcriptional regulator with XRE-family HTH domain
MSNGALRMPPSGSPTARRRLLAAELRRLRVGAGKTAEEVGRTLEWSKAKVSRYELAQSGLRPEDVARLLDLFMVEGAQRDRLLALAEEATHKGWWEAYSDVLTEGHMAYIGLEAEATSLLEWQINSVPGLLQTEQYAWEVLSSYQRVASISPNAIRRQVETRGTRQQLLTRGKRLNYTALLDESVLYRQRGDRSVMRAQLESLAEAAELPNVTIRILPLKRNHGFAVDSFAILQFGAAEEGVALPDVVSLEHLSNELHVERDSDAHMFRLAFGHLTTECLPPTESRKLILATCWREWG